MCCVLFVVDSLRDIISNPSRDVVFEKIAKRSTELTDSTDTYVLLRKGNIMTCVAQSGGGVHEVGVEFPIRKHITGAIFENGQPKLVNNYKDWDEKYKVDYPSEVEHAMGAPLSLGGEVFGVIVAVRLGNRPYSEEDFDKLQTFAMLASIELGSALNIERLNIANRKLSELNYRKTVRISETEEELREKNQKLIQKNDELKELLIHMDEINDSNKKLLAEYMHDDTLQTLYGATMLSKAALSAYRNNSENTEQLLEKLYEQMGVMEESLRQTIFTMRPFILDCDDLAALIRKYMESTQRKSGIAVTFTDNYKGQIANRDCAMVIYQVVNEAVTNAYHHARCKSLYVTMETEQRSYKGHTGGYLVTTITDDGIGFDEGHNKGHYGIRIMKTRAESVDGRVVISSQPGAGTTVTLYIPVDKLN